MNNESHLVMIGYLLLSIALIAVIAGTILYPKKKRKELDQIHGKSQNETLTTEENIDQKFSQTKPEMRNPTSLTAILDLIPVGFILFDRNRKVRFCNSSGLSTLGHLEVDLKKINIEELFSGDSRQKLRFQLKCALAGHSNTSWSQPPYSKMRHSKGFEIPVEFSVNILPFEDRPDFILSFRDASEQVYQKKMIQKVDTELRRKSEDLESFVYSVSHDLKAPMVTFSAFLGLMRLDLENNNTSQLTANLTCLEQANMRMRDLVDDLLQLSLSKNRYIKNEEIELSECINEIFKAYQSEITSKGIKLQVAPDLPKIFSDRLRVQQILENLIENALKYGCRASNPVIKIEWTENLDEIAICVKDNGEGIDPGHQGRIFKLFERHDTSLPGTGLGLSIVERAVQAIGGRFWLNSSSKTGSAFWVAFPKLRLENQQIDFLQDRIDYSHQSPLTHSHKTTTRGPSNEIH